MNTWKGPRQPGESPKLEDIVLHHLDCGDGALRIESRATQSSTSFPTKVAKEWIVTCRRCESIWVLGPEERIKLMRVLAEGGEALLDGGMQNVSSVNSGKPNLRVIVE